MPRTVKRFGYPAQQLDALRPMMQDPNFGPGPSPELIVADPWVVSSLLQKSIRRGEVEIAHRAALTLFQSRGSAIWRRFMVIAFEDVGIGSVDAVTMTVAAGSNAACRRACGDDLRVVLHLAGILAAAPKDRSADHLTGAKDHPALAEYARATAIAPVVAALSSVCDTTLDLPHRAVAARFASGIGDGSAHKGDLGELLTIFRDSGVPEDLVAATHIAAGRTREPITVMVPLIWLAASTGQQSVCGCAVPPLARANDVPLYALDMHTRLGREAIWRLACENEGVRNCLERFVPASQRRRAANVTAFYADAAPVARRLVWDQSDALEAFGVERDLLHAGVPREGIKPLLDVVRANLGHLNELRAQGLARSQTGRPAMPATRTAVP
jgi:hypothetical protein